MIHYDSPEDSFVNSEVGQAQSRFKDLFRFTEAIKLFDPAISGKDQDWEFHIKINRKWHVLNVKSYEDSWYCNLNPSFSNSFYERGNSSFSFNLVSTDRPSEHSEISDIVSSKIGCITDILQEIAAQVKEDHLKYHSQLLRALPPTLRWGVAPSPLIRDLLPNLQSFQSDLSGIEIKKSCEICDAPSPDPIPQMTARKFFDYCRIAYCANPGSFDSYELTLDPDVSGLELYKTYSDGRDAGLSKINLDSPEAFSNWYNSQRNFGAHPWEIYRGGNSTHIDLRVDKVDQSHKKGWQITLSAFSSSRLAETCRIAMALDKAQMPFELEDKKSYLQRLRGEDMIGIVPDGYDTKYGWHNFPREFNVADTIHWSWIKQSGEQSRSLLKDLKNATTWLPIRPLRVR